MSVTLNPSQEKVLKLIAKSWPVASSIHKVMLATSLDRATVKSIVEQLCRLHLVSCTTKNEVYLLALGKEQCNVGSAAKDKTKKRVTTKTPEPRNAEPVSLEQANEEKRIEATTKTSNVGVLNSIEALGAELVKAKQPFVVADSELKVMALKKLALIVSDDIGDLLVDVASDLERIENKAA